MRHLVTFVLVAVATAAGALWWLHDGDLAEAVAPVMPKWDATSLARDAGVPSDPVPPIEAQDPPPEAP